MAGVQPLIWVEDGIAVIWHPEEDEAQVYAVIYGTEYAWPQGQGGFDAPIPGATKILRLEAHEEYSFIDLVQRDEEEGTFRYCTEYTLASVQEMCQQALESIKSGSWPDPRQKEPEIC
jgi:hypothetical protein